MISKPISNLLLNHPLRISPILHQLNQGLEVRSILRNFIGHLHIVTVAHTPMKMNFKSKTGFTKNKNSLILFAACFDAKLGVLVTQHKIYQMPFSSIYPHYVAKVQKKGRTSSELHTIIEWLTGYEPDEIKTAIDTDRTLEVFFGSAPKLNPNRNLIKGVICGIRVEEISEPLMQEIRYLDKLVDELAKGKKMSAILRQ